MIHQSFSHWIKVHSEYNLQRFVLFQRMKVQNYFLLNQIDPSWKVFKGVSHTDSESNQSEQGPFLGDWTNCSFTASSLACLSCDRLAPS